MPEDDRQQRNRNNKTVWDQKESHDYQVYSGQDAERNRPERDTTLCKPIRTGFSYYVN
jgi:hypothetical protein